METKIVIVGEAWGRHEAEAGRPLVGPTGELLNRLCEESGLLPPGSAYNLNKALYQRRYDYRDEVYHAAGIYLTNVFNLQPPGNRIEDLCGPRWGTLPAIRAGKYIREEFVGQLERLRSELVEHEPNLILGLGATAMWFALGTTAIRKQRGTVAQSPYGKFLGTWHPAYLMRGAWDQRPIVVADLIKARREAESPEVRRPNRFVYIPETVSDLERMFCEMASAERLSIDIETAADQITCIGFSWSPSHAFVIPIFDTSKPDRCYWNHNEEPVVWDWIRRLCGLPMPKVFQNGLYDIHFLWRRYGITVANCTDDTMLLHHALQPEMQKGLGFLGSIYTDEPAWKLMRGRGKEATVKDLREE